MNKEEGIRKKGRGTAKTQVLEVVEKGWRMSNNKEKK
jgi:hypothetical protein